MMLFLQIMAALILLLLACAVGELDAVRRDGAAASRRTPHQSASQTASPQGEALESAADGGEQTEAERAAEKKYTEGVLNILNYSAENARKGDTER